MWKGICEMNYSEIKSCAGEENSFCEWLNQQMKPVEFKVISMREEGDYRDRSCVIEYKGLMIYVCFFYDKHEAYPSDFCAVKNIANMDIKYVLYYYSKVEYTQKNTGATRCENSEFYFVKLNEELKSQLLDKDGVNLDGFQKEGPISFDEMKRRLLQEVYKVYKCMSHDYIISGPPGAGKSRFVDKCVIPKIIDPPEKAGTEKYNEFIESHCERILFSDAVYHETFFGGYRPVMKGGNIAYAFAPGPFCHILKKAYQNRDENFVLVIEEFNRGDAYDILGEVFQLLDRNKDTMTSEYKVSLSDEAKKWFEEDDANGEGVKKEKIYLPDNLFIICTMNNADSGVRYIDTAMKRRFQMIFIDEDGKIYGAKKTNNEQYIPFDETNAERNDRVLPGKESITLEQWEKWRERINEVISKSSTEDKLISRHFIDIPKDADKETKVIDGDQFIIKVLGYLYQNVFRGKEGEIGEIEGLAGITEDCRSIIGLLKKYHGSDKFSFNIDENE